MRARWLAVVTAAVSLVVVGCDGDPEPPGPPPPPAPGDDGRYSAPEVPRGPGVTIGISSPYTGFNPRTWTAGGSDVLVANQVLASPFIRDAGLRLSLATDVMVSAESAEPDDAGQQRVTYRIKPGVRWSDGAPWDCDDLYLAWLAENSASARKEADGSTRYDRSGRPDRYFAADGNPAAPPSSGECTDALTFVETFDEPFPDWRESYAGPSILPAHILEQRTGIIDITAVGPDSAPMDLENAARFWQSGWTGFDPATMPASGAYRIESWEPGRSVRLEPNASFAGNLPGPASLTLTVVDPAAAPELLRTGAVDVLSLDPQTAENALALKESDPRVTSEVVGGGSFSHVAFNTDSSLGSGLAVRLAVAQCLDRAELADRLIRETDPLVVPRGSLLFPPGDPGYRDAYGDLMVSNPDLSKFTLESDGWQLGADAVYQRAGQRLRLSILHDGSPRNLATVDLIRSRCREAGIEIVDDVDPARLTDRLRRGEFDAALLVSPTWRNRSAPQSTYMTTGRTNITGFSDPDVDVTWQQVSASFDPGRRVVLLREIDRVIAESAVDLPLFDVPTVVTHPRDLEGVSFQPVEGITWNANAWRRP